jgi:hypothetical protein
MSASRDIVVRWQADKDTALCPSAMTERSRLKASIDRAQQAQSQHQETANTVLGVVATLGNRTKTRRRATLVLVVPPYEHASQTAVNACQTKHNPCRLWCAHCNLTANKVTQAAAMHYTRQLALKLSQCSITCRQRLDRGSCLCPHCWGCQ